MKLKVALLVIALAGCALLAVRTFAANAPPAPPIPADNPMSPAKVELGKILFFDPRLSKSGTVSCNSCHNVMAGGDDSRPNSVGVAGKTGERSSPTVWNSAFLTVQFWDGRANTLEDQAKGPLLNPVEMGMESHETVIKRIAAAPDYHKLFHAAFPGEAEPLTIGNVAKAIASYERTLISMDSPYDRYMAGDKTALSPAAKKGMDLANSIGCTSCHNGQVFAGPALETGQGFYMKFPTNAGSAYETQYNLAKDPGRYSVTKDEGDKNMWRVAMWRNVGLTAPYFHNGSVANLQEAVKVMAKTQLGKDVNDQDAADIAAFLESLTGTFPEQTMPRLPAITGHAGID